MGEVRTEPVKAQRVDVVSSVSPPGAFKYYVQGKSIYQQWAAPDDGQPPAGVVFNCPCGCGSVGWLAFRGHQAPGRPAWDWDGNLEAPTLNPSVWDKGHWHGWLRNGVWQSC